MTDPDETLLDEACAALMEHFDSVRIVATKHDGATAQTAIGSRGAGNYYAQRDSVRTWLREQDQLDTEHLTGLLMDTDDETE